MELIVLVVAVLVVGSLALKIAKSILSALVAVVLAVALLFGTGIVDPGGLFERGARDAKRTVDKRLRQAGCGEGGGIVIGDTDRCRSYRSARASCERRSSAKRRSACRKRVMRTYKRDGQDAARPARDRR